IYVDNLAWSPSGKEIWFDGINRQLAAGIYAVGLDGRVRLVSLTTDLEVMHDIARDGSVLVEREINTREILGAFGGNPQERNLSWLDQSNAAALSPDGKTMLFWESGEGGGPSGSVYLRSTDGSAAARLGDGHACDLSPDGKWALTIQTSGKGASLVLLPTGAGGPQPIALDKVLPVFAAFMPPDGKKILIAGSEPGQGVRAYLMDLPSGKPRAATPELSNGGALSPDGQFLAATGADRRALIVPVAGGAPRILEGLELEDVPIQWSADGQDLFVTHYGEAPLPIYRYHLKSGKKELWKQLLPADRTGFVRIESVVLTRDGSSYAYSYNRVTSSDLFLVTGWK
ncbi:MAG TPA: hypothetical protein VJA66_17810, partial [Thermoanaerobaculia bacterium]